MAAAKNIFRKKFTRADWIIIITNLIPVAGVWFWHWGATDVFIVYAMETMLAGILTVLKLIIATFARGKDTWYNGERTADTSGLFFILFFILHFGLFAAVQTSIFSQTAGITPPGKSFFYFFLHWWEFITEDIACMLAGFVISYFVRDLIPFLHRREYQTLPMMIIMFQPYGRVIIQQFTVILGSMFLSFGLGSGFVLVFALVKIFVEVYLRFGDILNHANKTLKRKSGK